MHSHMKLLVATTNAHKLSEIRAIFSEPSIDLLSLDAFPDAPEVEEDCDTFEGNAAKKAVTLALTTGLWTMADDSGLEVEALGGAPGVRSARYAGEPADYRANNEKILKELAGEKNRAARFRCAIALSDPSGQVRVVEGECRGRIVEEPRGESGFGYDPLFVPDGERRTFAEMASGEKNRISHRARALASGRGVLLGWMEFPRTPEFHKACEGHPGPPLGD